ncbi:MAG: ZIP family metal transporter [Candidatus Thorarchaeota archaeon]
MADISQLTIIGILLGLYVGLVPVYLGFYFLPILKRLSHDWLNVIVSISLGVLVFLFVDVVAESIEMAEKLPAGMQIPADGQATVPPLDRMLFDLISRNQDIVFFLGPIILILGFTAGLGILIFIETLVKSAESAKKTTQEAKETSKSKNPGNKLSLIGIEELSPPFILAAIISFGIGLHNLGEGLAVGVAYGTGNITLATVLIFGFAIHNVTEGLAITAPVSKSTVNYRTLFIFGLLAGGPTIVGSLLGIFVFSNGVALFFFALAAGSLLKVVIDITSHIGNDFKKNKWNFFGLALGFFIMYLTSLLVIL